VPQAAIIGTGESGYTRHPEPGQNTHTFLRDAVVMALKDANLKLSDVDGLAISSFSMEPDKSIDMAWRFGMTLRWLLQDTNGGAGGINMLGHAARGIEAGAASVIVVVAGDAMGLEGFARLSANYNRAIRDHVAPLGHGGPNSLFAMLTQRQMAHYGLKREDYGAMVIAQRAWAGGNPGAVYRQPLTMDEYLKAGMVCDPLCRYDCVPPVAGASCVIVSTADRAPPHRKPVRVRALKQSFNYDNQEGVGLQTGLTKVADELWAAAGVSPLDIDLAAIYDDYPAMVLAQLNDLKLIPGNDLATFARARIGTRKFPVNTSGGLLSAGQAGSAGGMNGTVEAVRQLQHCADGRQVPNARLAVVSGYGMVLYRYGACVGAAVLERMS
jgi:acetyl-CoA acetyltransferase